MEMKYIMPSLFNVPLVQGRPEKFITPPMPNRPVKYITPAMPNRGGRFTTPITPNEGVKYITPPTFNGPVKFTTPAIGPEKLDPLLTYIGERAKGWRDYPGVETPEGGYVPEGAFSRLADKKVRKEISDDGATLTPTAKKYLERGTEIIADPYIGVKVKDTISHPELYNNYPEISDYLFGGKMLGELDKLSKDYSQRGSYGKGIIQANGLNSEDISSTLLHELQHAIQEKEGFARGGSPTEFVRQYKSIQKDLEDQIDAINSQLSGAVGTPRYEDLLNEREYIRKEYQKLMGDYHIGPLEKGHEDYKRLAGEVEARDVQARMNMNNKQRMKSQPYASQGIPVDRQIVRYGGGKAENTIRPRKVSRVEVKKK